MENRNDSRVAERGGMRDVPVSAIWGLYSAEKDEIVATQQGTDADIITFTLHFSDIQVLQ